MERLEEAERERDRRSRERLRDAEVSQYEARQGLLREMELLRAREQVIFLFLYVSFAVGVRGVRGVCVSIGVGVAVAVAAGVGVINRQAGRQTNKTAVRQTDGQARHNRRADSCCWVLVFLTMLSAPNFTTAPREKRRRKSLERAISVVARPSHAQNNQTISI